VFVLTHHLRPSLPMEGGTTFHFTDEAAAGQDVRIGGGPATLQQYLRAGLVDELHLAIVPILAGRGERLLDNLGDAIDGYQVSEQVSSTAAPHARLVRR
jgi:dihydrofolate reductase